MLFELYQFLAVPHAVYITHSCFALAVRQESYIALSEWSYRTNGILGPTIVRNSWNWPLKLRRTSYGHVWVILE